MRENLRFQFGNSSLNKDGYGRCRYMPYIIRNREFQKRTDEKLEQIFEYIPKHEESSQKIFFDGQIYDGFSLIVSLIKKTDKEIMLIDGYIDFGTVHFSSRKKENVTVTVIPLSR